MLERLIITSTFNFQAFLKCIGCSNVSGIGRAMIRVFVSHFSLFISLHSRLCLTLRNDSKILVLGVLPFFLRQIFIALIFFAETAHREERQRAMRASFGFLCFFRNADCALKLLARATALPERKIDYYDRSETVQARLHKSLKVWSLYADLEETFGSFKTCKAVYDHIIDLRIATPLTVINYGMFLESNNYFEEAFKVRDVLFFVCMNLFAGFESNLLPYFYLAKRLIIALF